VIILGLLLLVWGGLLLGMARPLHDNWREMLGRLRAAGYSRPPFGTRFVASARGLRTFRVAGGCGLAVGAALLAAGLLRLR
jgi:hypothetical protein